MTEFIKAPVLYRPLIIGSMVMILRQFSGINAVLGYCHWIFQTADIKDASLVSIIISITLIVFTLLSAVIVDKCGRRILLILGGFSMFVMMLLLGLYFDITVFGTPLEGQVTVFNHRTVPVSKISWLAVTCIITFISMYSLSWGPISWMLLGEFFSPKARGTAAAICNVVNWLATFLIMKFFPLMKDNLKDQGVFWFYAGSCLFSSFFTVFFVPETKGKTLEEIEDYFRNKSPKYNEYEKL